MTPFTRCAQVALVLFACVVFAVLASSTLPVLRSIGITVVLGVASNFLLSQLLIRRRDMR